MNKHEAIEELDKTSSRFFRAVTSPDVEANTKTLSTGVFAGLGIAKRVLAQLDELQAVKVPLHVGNWIEYSKDEGWDFLRSIQEMKGPMGDGSVARWFKNNSDKYAEAWSNDFGIEEAAEWVVRVKGMYFLNWGEDGTCPTFVIDDNPGAKLQAKPFIKSEGQALAVSLKGCIEKV